MTHRLLFLSVAAAMFAQSQTPVIAPGGVIGAGLSSPTQSLLSPGAIFSVFGTDLAPAGTNASATLVDGALATVLGHTCLEVNGVRAPLFAVLPGQINAQAPTSVAGPGATVTVITACDSDSPVMSAPAYAVVEDASPEFFYVQYLPAGLNQVAAFDTNTNALVGPGDNSLPFATQPAAPGDIVVLYADGLGSTSPPVAAGTLASGAASLASPYSISLAGNPVDASDILYAGVSPGFAGLYQINLRIPFTAPAGPQPISITVNGIPSPPSASLYIASGGCALPVIQSFTSFPSQLASPGATVISWATEGASSIATQPALGSTATTTSVTQNVSASATYQLTATNACGSAVASLQVGVGTPVVTGLENTTGKPVSSVEVGDTVQLAAQNMGDPANLQNVVLTTPDGLVYGFPIEYNDDGSLYFQVPMLPEFSASAPTTVTVSLLTVSGQITAVSTQTLSVSLPVYNGDAITDFGLLLNQLIGTYTNAVNAQTTFPGGGTASGLTQGFTAVLAPLQNALSEVQANGSAQIPFVPATASVPNPPMLTITAQEINLIMALMQKVSDDPTDLFESTESEPRRAFEYRPQDTSGACPQSILYRAPYLFFCKNIEFPKNVAKVLGLMSTVGTAAFAAFAVAPPVGLTAAGGASALLGLAGVFASALCYSQPIWLQKMAFSPASLPNTFGMSNPMPTKVQLQASLGPNLAEIGGALLEQSLFILKNTRWIAAGIESLLPLANATNGLANTNAVDRGIEKAASWLGDQLAKNFPNLTVAGSNVNYQVGYCAGDIISPINPPEGFTLPYVMEQAGPAGQTSGMNDFYLLGKQPTTSGPLALNVIANKNAFLLPANHSNLSCQENGDQVRCKTYLSVGTPQTLTFSSTVQVGDSCPNTTCCVTKTGPTVPVTTASPYSLQLNNGIGSAAVMAQQTGDSTWRIFLTATSFGSPGNPLGTEGCEAVTTTTSIVNPIAGSTPATIVVTVNPDSSPIQPTCSRGALGGITPGPLTAVVPGTYTLPASLIPIIAQMQEVQIIANTGDNIGQFNSPCVIDLTIQITNGTSTGTSVGTAK